MQVIIDRFENDMVVVEIKPGMMANISKTLVPMAKEGDILNITINKQETNNRSKKIDDLMNQVFRDN